MSFLAPRRAKARLFRAVLGRKTNKPHIALKRFERLSADATLWIFWGIALETGATIWFWRGWIETGIAVAANVLIGAGLIVEYVVILRARLAAGAVQRDAERKVADAEARSAEANQKANEAELALAQLEERLAPRRLTQEGQRLIAEHISEFSGMIGEIGSSPPEFESMRLEMAIHAALAMGGWKIARGQPTHTSMAGGVTVWTTPDFATVAAGISLSEILNELGIRATPNPMLNDGPPRVFVNIGSKPEPSEDDIAAAKTITAALRAAIEGNSPSTGG